LAKDFNDLLVAGEQISLVKFLPIDIYVANELLKQNQGDIQGQQKAIEKFSKTIKNPLIKAELAKILAKTWGYDLDTVKEFLKVSENTTVDEIISEFKDAYTCINEMEDSILHHEGITTGYPSLDQSIEGLSLTDVFFIAARPGIGKTFVLMEIALHMAIRLKLNVVLFSLEMSAAKLYKRIVANIYGISVKELVRRVKNKEINYELVLSKIQEYLYINDNPSLSIDDIEERVLAVNSKGLFKHNKGKTQIIGIDYVQMMPKMSDFTYFEEKVMSFKPIARRLNIVLIALSQMARTVKSWEEPDLSNLKGGGAIDAVGDLAWLLWKVSENPKLSAIDRQQMEESGEDNVIDSKIGKARNGIEGKRYIRLISNKETTSVKEMA
jgi:replicative DNA helicase